MLTDDHTHRESMSYINPAEPQRQFHRVRGPGTDRYYVVMERTSFDKSRLYFVDNEGDVEPRRIPDDTVLAVQAKVYLPHGIAILHPTDQQFDAGQLMVPPSQGGDEGPPNTFPIFYGHGFMKYQLIIKGKIVFRLYPQR
jgi:hypothetical protein